MDLRQWWEGLSLFEKVISALVATLPPVLLGGQAVIRFFYIRAIREYDTVSAAILAESYKRQAAGNIHIIDDSIVLKQMGWPWRPLIRPAQRWEREKKRFASK